MTFLQKLLVRKLSKQIEQADLFFVFSELHQSHTSVRTTTLHRGRHFFHGSGTARNRACKGECALHQLFLKVVRSEITLMRSPVRPKSSSSIESSR